MHKEGKYIRKRKHYNKKAVTILASLVMVIGMVIGGTIAYLIDDTESVVNTFTPGNITVDIEEKFDGDKKENVTATNTGNVDAYIRITLVTYRVNADGQRIGGTATIPTFEPGDGWMKDGNTYYYTQPVAPRTTISPVLIESITLVDNYKDADGGKQVIEVIAEGIQADPETTVESAWGVTVENGVITGV